MQTRFKIKKEIVDNYKTNYSKQYSLNEYITKFFHEIKNDYLLNDDEFENILTIIKEEEKSNN